MATTLLRSALLRAGIAAAVVLTGCGDGTSARDEAEVEIYVAAIRWLVGNEPDVQAAAQERLFIEAAGEEAIPLGVQAELVTRLEDEGELAVRFIDTREEAIDTLEPADPVRDDGVLIGLGPLPDIARTPVRLYAERYREVRDVVAYEIVLERRDGRWQVTGEPQRVRVEDEDQTLGT